MTSLTPDSVINVAGRSFQLVGFADQDSQELYSSSKSESTVGIINPSGYRLMGTILSRAQDMRLKLVNVRLARLYLDSVQLLLPDLVDSPNFKEIAADMTSDVVLLLELAGTNAVETWLSIVRSPDWADTQRGAPASLRALSRENRVCNVIHGSQSLIATSRELGTFFGKGDYRSTAIFSFCALCIIKPHCVNPHTGRILDRILEADLEISAVKSMTLSIDQIHRLMDVYRGVISDFGPSCEHLAAGPIVAIQVRGENVVQRLREIAGPYDPAIARQVAPNSLRALYGSSIAMNGIHCTDLEAAGILECELLFR